MHKNHYRTGLKIQASNKFFYKNVVYVNLWLVKIVKPIYATTSVNKEKLEQTHFLLHECVCICLLYTSDAADE